MYSANYNQMMQLIHGAQSIQNNPMQMQMQQHPSSLFGNMQPQPQFHFPPMPPSNFSHQNIAQFGSSNQPQPFFGQNMHQGPWNQNNQKDKK